MRTPSVLVAVLLLACGSPEPAAPSEGPEAPAPVEAAPAPAEGRTYTCHTVRHRIEVAAAGDGAATYRTWSAGADAGTQPELALDDGSLRVEGSGPCRKSVWTFATDDARYVLEQGGCGDPDDTAEPAPGGGEGTGRLQVFRGEELLSNRRCGAVAAPAPAAAPAPTYAAVEGATGTSRYDVWTISWDETKARAVGSQGTSVRIFEPTPGVTNRVLSVVGPYVSVEREADGVKAWSVTDVRAAGEAVDLRDVFSDAAIYNALRMDKRLDRALRGKEAADLVGFLAALDGGCTMSLSPEMTRAFAFHGLEGNVVTVRIGVPHGCEIERGTFTEFDLRLPIGALMPMLIPADAAGTLLEDR